MRFDVDTEIGKMDMPPRHLPTLLCSVDDVTT